MEFILVNKTATLISSKGVVYQRQELSKEEIQKLQNLTSSGVRDEYRYIEIINPELSKNEERVLEIETQFESKLEDFKGKDIFLKYFTIDEIGRVAYKLYETTKEIYLPEDLILAIKNTLAKEGDILPLVKFWEFTVLNVNENSRQGLFKFIKKQNLIITDNGYFVTYRRARILKKSSNKLEKFVTESCLKIRSQKTSLSRFAVCEGENDEYILINKTTKTFADFKGNVLGDLKELESQLSESMNGKFNKTVLTDAHTGTMEFRCGDVVKIDRRKCDEDPNVECSRGLHVGSFSFVSQNLCFGEVVLLCLVNPRNVVSVPYNDAHKMRVCEYKIIGVSDSAQTFKELDSSEINRFEHEYIDYENEVLEEELRNITIKVDYSDSKELAEERKTLLGKISHQTSVLLQYLGFKK